MCSFFMTFYCNWIHALALMADFILPIHKYAGKDTFASKR